MDSQQLIDAIRAAQASGSKTMSGALHHAIRGVKNIRLRNLDGAINGNPHDIWVESESGKAVIGRIYLGSKKSPANTEKWEERIATIAVDQ